MKNVITQITLILIILAETLTAQTDTNKINEILFGTFLPSSPVNRTRWEMGDETLHNIGFNTVVQFFTHSAIHQKPIQNGLLKENRSAVNRSPFKHLIALNPVGTLDATNNLIINQTDWIRAYTASMDNVWEAEGEGPFYYDPALNDWSNVHDRIRMERSIHMMRYNDGIAEGVKTLYIGELDTTISQENTGPYISVLRGPYAYQYLDHYFMYREDASYRAKYHLSIRMKITKKPAENKPVCILRVMQETYTVGDGGWTLFSVDSLEGRVFYSNDFDGSNIYTEFQLPLDPNTGNPTTYSLKTNPSGSTDYEERTGYPAETSDTAQKVPKIYYEVLLFRDTYKDSSYGELYIDKFHVWDELVTEQHAKRDSTMINRLNLYHSLYAASDSAADVEAYNNKVKYFHGLSEPHSYDNFRPNARLEEILTRGEVNFKKQPLIIMYPEFSGVKEGVDVLKRWGEIAKPKKFCFWYYTIFGVDNETLIAQQQLRGYANKASLYDKDWYYVAQAWGTKDTLGNWKKYRTPTGTEALGQTMTVLAFGCKGLLYETYYSYLSENSLLGGKYYVSGIVGWMNDTSDITNFYKIRPNDRSLYDTLVSIGERLKGPLGKTLYGLYFDGQHIYRDLNNVTYYFNISDIKISEIPGVVQPTSVNLVGLTELKKKSGSSLFERYFFLYNINTGIDSSRYYWNDMDVAVLLKKNKNHVFYNVEDSINENYGLYGTGEFQYVHRIDLGPGGGKLFRLARKAAYRGDLSLSETIEFNEQLTSEGKIVIPENVTLTIEGTYNLVDTLLVETGGKLQINPGGRIIMKEGSSIYCSGEITAEGTESNRAVIDFSSPDPQKYNSIHLSPPAKLVLKNTDLKNGYTAVNALAGYDSLLIENCKFSNFADAAINLNGDGTEMAKIVSNRYSSCVYPVYATNLQTLLVKDDSASVSAGYYAGSVTDARISGTKITGTGSGIGIHFSGINSGYVQGNTITGCNEGIHLSNASVKLGRNIITGNGSHGIKAESGSEADMRKYFDVICGSTSMSFPVSGYNEITGNGTNAAEANEGTEIFVENSSILLSEGGNRISDENMTEMNQMLLINGKSNDDPVHAEGNFWGESAPGGENFDVNAAVITSPELTIFNPVENHACSIRLSVPGYGIYDTLPATENYEGETEMMMYAQNLYESGSYDSAYTTYTALYAQATEKEKLQVLKGMFISGIKTSLKQSRLATVQYLADSLMQTTSDTILTANLRRLRVYLLAEGGNLEGAVMTAGENVAYMQGETDIFNAETEQITLEMRGSPVSGAITQKSQWALTSENAERSKKLKERNRKRYIIKKTTENSTEIITDYMLYQNYPNPFNAGTVIRYDMREAGEVNIKVYDILGREVRELVNERKEKGRYSIGFTPNELASGIYIFSMRTGTYQNARKMIIMK